MNAVNDAHPVGVIERRRWKRVPCDFEVRCGVEGGERIGKALNISGGGVLLQIPGEDCRPRKLFMTFVVPGSAGDRQVNVIGNVVRTGDAGGGEKGAGMGVSFVVIQSEVRRAIMSYVDDVSLVSPCRADAPGICA